MRRSLIALVMFFVLVSVMGCRSIWVGGSGDVGGVHGGGGVHIPVPK